MGPIANLALSGAAMCYGLSMLALTGTVACLEGYIFKRPPGTFWEEVEKKRLRSWDLSKPAHNNLNHHFFLMENGCKVHYLSNTEEKISAKNLVIFIHGWPDNSMLWEYVIQELGVEALKNNHIIAIDLPGHGGSDGISSYGPEGMLEGLVDIIAGLRELYTLDDSSKGKVVIVGHDWGSLLAFRLCSEAPQLADHFVTTNAGLPEMFKQNIRHRTASAQKMLWTSLRTLNFRLMRSAMTTFAPVIGQLKKSYYVFIYNLPKPLAKLALPAGNLWLLRIIASLARGRMPPKHDSDEAVGVAKSLGPNSAACQTKTLSGDTYGASVVKRAKEGGLFESIRLYREGLITKEWNKSLNTVAILHNLDNNLRRLSSPGGLIDDGPKGALKAPTTILWGEKDVAADSRIMLEGFGDYMYHGSQLILLPKLNHWTPIEKSGPAAIAAAIRWVLDGKVGDVGEKVAAVCEEARVSISK